MISKAVDQEQHGVTQAKKENRAKSYEKREELNDGLEEKPTHVFSFSFDF